MNRLAFVSVAVIAILVIAGAAIVVTNTMKMTKSVKILQEWKLTP